MGKKISAAKRMANIVLRNVNKTIGFWISLTWLMMLLHIVAELLYFNNH